MIFVIAGLLLTKMIDGFIPLPIGIRHALHLMTQPKDLYEPIITDNFRFYEKSFTRTYSLLPKYLDIYEIGFFTKNKNLPSQYKFNGKLKLEFFVKGKLISETIASSMASAVYAGKVMKYFKEVSLSKFDIPLMGKYKNDIMVKLTVLEGDQELQKYGDSIMLYIAVSATP